MSIEVGGNHLPFGKPVMFKSNDLISMLGQVIGSKQTTWLLTIFYCIYCIVNALRLMPAHHTLALPQEFG